MNLKVGRKTSWIEELNNVSYGEAGSLSLMDGCRQGGNDPKIKRGGEVRHIFILLFRTTSLCSVLWIDSNQWRFSFLGFKTCQDYKPSGWALTAPSGSATCCLATQMTYRNSEPQKLYFMTLATGEQDQDLFFVKFKNWNVSFLEFCWQVVTLWEYNKCQRTRKYPMRSPYGWLWCHSLQIND